MIGPPSSGVVHVTVVIGDIVIGSIQRKNGPLDDGIAGIEQWIQHHAHDRRKGIEGLGFLAGQLKAHLGTIGESGDEGPLRIEIVKTLQMDRQSREEAIIVDVELWMEVVVDIPEPIVGLVTCTIRTDHDEAPLVGQLDPAVVADHVVVVSAVSVKHYHHRRFIGNIIRDMNPILTIETVMDKGDVLSIGCHRKKQRQDDREFDSHLHKVSEIRSHSIGIMNVMAKPLTNPHICSHMTIKPLYLNSD